MLLLFTFQVVRKSSSGLEYVSNTGSILPSAIGQDDVYCSLYSDFIKKLIVAWAGVLSVKKKKQIAEDPLSIPSILAFGGKNDYETITASASQISGTTKERNTLISWLYYSCERRVDEMWGAIEALAGLLVQHEGLSSNELSKIFDTIIEIKPLQIKEDSASPDG